MLCSTASAASALTRARLLLTVNAWVPKLADLAGGRHVIEQAQNHRREHAQRQHAEQRSDESIVFQRLLWDLARGPRQIPRAFFPITAGNTHMIPCGCPLNETLRAHSSLDFHRSGAFLRHANPFLRRHPHDHRLDVSVRDQRQTAAARMRVVPGQTRGIDGAQSPLSFRSQTDRRRGAQPRAHRSLRESAEPLPCRVSTETSIARSPRATSPASCWRIRREIQQADAAFVSQKARQAEACRRSNRSTRPVDAEKAVRQFVGDQLRSADSRCSMA